MADNKKLIDLTGLSRLAEKLNEKSNEKMSNLETTLSTSIADVREMLGGKSLVYLTCAEYNLLSDEEKNDETKVYNLIDAEDTSHDHNNLEFLENLGPRNIIIGSKTNIFDGTSDVTFTLKDIGAAEADHNHDNLYYTKNNIDSMLSDLEDGVGENYQDIEAKLAQKAPLTHDHNDLYYTESEVNTLLADKSDSDHAHDDLYYTEAEIDNKLTGKSDSDHTHNDIYYTETEIDNKLNDKANKTHNHDEMYYTEAEIDNKIGDINTSLANKSDTGHTHTEYASKSEFDNNLESIGESIESIESEIATVKGSLAGKSDNGHEHGDLYYTESEVDALLNGKSDTDHGHTEYYNKSEIDSTISTLNSNISGKADSDHNHNDIYYTETEIDNKINTINTTITTKEAALQTSIATNKTTAVTEAKSYTDTAISNLVNSAPESLNTLKELADAIELHKDDYEAYVETVNAAIAKAKTDAIAEAAAKDTALHTTISAEIDADVLAEKQRAMQAEAALEGHIAEKAEVNHAHDDKYYTEAEINATVSSLQKEIDDDVEVEKVRAMDAESKLEAKISTKADANHGSHIPTPEATADNTRFLRNDNTWQKVTPANIGAAPTSHGTHIPAAQAADAATFLRNDNTWQKVTPDNIGAATASHSHDDIYYTETEINNKLTDINETISSNYATLNSAIEGKAPSVHGNHVPATQTVDNTKFLRNDNTWAKVTPENIGAATSSHEHNTIYYTQAQINAFLEGKAAADHGHDEFYTKAQVDTKVDGLSESLNEKEAALQSQITGILNDPIFTNLILNGYSIWVGTTEELNNIVKQPDTLYFKIDDNTDDDEVVQNTPVNSILTLTTNLHQTATITDGVEIRFPEVSSFTEIHLYFDAQNDTRIILPDNCKWRLDSNIEAGMTYELVAKYIPGPNHWIVNILAYS